MTDFGSPIGIVYLTGGWLVTEFADALVKAQRHGFPSVTIMYLHKFGKITYGDVIPLQPDQRVAKTAAPIRLATAAQTMVDGLRTA